MIGCAATSAAVLRDIFFDNRLDPVASIPIGSRRSAPRVPLCTHFETQPPISWW
jgi:hypothetical protein